MDYLFTGCLCDRKIHGRSDPSEWIIEKLQAIAHPVKSAVDIASGAGRHSLLLSELCPSVTAVDRNPDLSSFFANTSVEFCVWTLSKKTGRWSATLLILCLSQTICTARTSGIFLI